MPPIRRIPPKPITQPPRPPGPIMPPLPPPGGGAGLPPGPITITPVGPPKPPVEPVPPQYGLGMWSDGWVVIRQQSGSLILDASNGLHLTWGIRHVYGNEEIARQVINQILGVIGTGARATAVEPWPVRATASRKSVGALMSDITLADLAAQIQVLIINSEQVNSRLAAIEEHLAGAETEQPPAPPATDDDAEFWAQFLAAVDPDPETFEPEIFDFYSRGRVLYQWRAGYTPTGKRIYPATPVARKMDYIRKMYVPDSAEAQPWIQAGVAFETAVYGILAGWCDEVFATGFGARPQSAILPLAGKSAADLFAKDIAAAGQGGTASGNEG